MAAPPDRSIRSLCPDSSQQDLAGSLPASCPVPAAPCPWLSPPRWLGEARGCDMKASLPWGLLPVCRSLRQPQLTGPGGPGEDVSQMAHTTASSNADWSTPEPGRAGMLRAVGIPSSCCSKLATPGTMLSPAAGSPRRTPLQGVTTGPSQGRSWAGRWAALQGPCGSRGRQEEPPSLLTAGPHVLGPAGPGQCPHTAGEGSCSLASSSTTC